MDVEADRLDAMRSAEGFGAVVAAVTVAIVAYWLLERLLPDVPRRRRERAGPARVETDGYIKRRLRPGSL